MFYILLFLTSIQASHPLYLPDVGDLFPYEVGEHPDRDVGDVAHLLPVVLLKHLRQVPRHVVRDDHDQLVAALGAADAAGLVSFLVKKC